MKIAICDDGRRACIRITSMAKEILRKEDILYSASEYERWKELLVAIRDDLTSYGISEEKTLKKL